MKLGTDRGFRTCFISAPINTDTAPLRAALERNEIQWLDTATAPATGFSALDTINGAINRADFVCGIFPKRPHDGGVLVELGMAIGHGRPLLIFVDPSASLPSELQSVPFARISLEEKDALDLHLSAFLKHADASAFRRRAPQSTISEPADTQWALRQIEALDSSSSNNRGLELEGIVARLLEQAGAIVSSKPQRTEFGADMAISIDALEPTLGNPLLVEVKAGRLSPARINEAERNLRMSVEKSDSRAGLLVLGSSNSDNLVPKGWPLIIRMGVRDLARHVSRGSFVQALVAARNEAVHGRT